jgi:hypothetical protein
MDFGAGLERVLKFTIIWKLVMGKSYEAFYQKAYIFDEVIYKRVCPSGCM